MSLCINLFGSLVVTRNQTPLELSRAKRIEALLVYLTIHPQPHSREKLTALLFPDLPDKTARANLRQTLKRLRDWLGDTSPPFLLISTDWVQMNPTAVYHTDYQKQQTLLAGCTRHAPQPNVDCSDCIAMLENALYISSAPLLDGFFITDSEPFELWLQSQRQQQGQQTRQAGQMVADYYEQRGAYAKAEAILRHLLTLEPWHEAIYPQLMRLLAWQGKRGAALQLYKKGVASLMDELGIEPSLEMTQWAERIRQQPEQRPFDLPPLASTPFVGRQQLQEQIRAHLLQHRLITLWGVGGVGKTQLALHIGWAVAQTYWGPFAEGVFWLTITSQHTPEQLTTELGEWLGFSSSQQLQDKAVLLILDNSELLPSASIDWLGELLQNSQQLTILVTSRERLQLSAEWSVEIAGLPYPQAHPQQTPFTTLPDSTYSAMTLFYKRAHQVKANFAQDPTAVARICQLTQGLPLALELAAVWVQTLTCAQIAQEIATSLEILQTTKRDTHPRHQSIQAVFEASWQRLSSIEQEGLCGLAVFNGRFDLPAAKEVTGIRYPTLTQLINKSLLQSHPPYFQLHPLLHQFLQEKVNKREILQTKLAHYYGQLLETYDKRLNGIDMADILADMQAQIGSIRWAWQWAIDRQNLALIERYAPTLYQFYALRGWRYEGRDMFQKACDLRHHLPATEHPLLFTHLLTRLAEFMNGVGEPHKAEALLQESLAIGGLVEDEAELALLYKKLGLLAHQRGDYETAQQQLILSKQILLEVNNQASFAHALMSLGAVLQAQNLHQQAKTTLQESLGIYQALEHKWGIAHTCRLLGQIEVEQREWEIASQYYAQGLQAAQGLQDVISTALLLNEVGQLAQLNKQFERAEQAFERAIQLLEPLGDKRGLMRIWHSWGRLTVAQTKHLDTVHYYKRAFDLAVEMQELPYLLKILTDIALLTNNDQRDELLHLVYHHPICSQQLKRQIEAHIEAQFLQRQMVKRPFATIQQQIHHLLDHLAQEETST